MAFARSAGRVSRYETGAIQRKRLERTDTPHEKELAALTSYFVEHLQDVELLEVESDGTRLLACHSKALRHAIDANSRMRAWQKGAAGLIKTDPGISGKQAMTSEPNFSISACDYTRVLAEW